MWHIHNQSGIDGFLHIWPCADLVPHDTDDYDAASCMCGPTTETRPDGVVIVTHHSLDGRENIE